MRSEVRVTRSLRYGRASTLELEVAPQTLLADPVHAPCALSDPKAATIAALSNPRQYPPLSQAVVPGDRVAIAASADIPCLPEIVAGVRSVLEQAGLAQDDVHVVVADSANLVPETRVIDDAGDGLAWERHDPSDKSVLCYLAAAESGAPIYLNRHLCEADVVIPIGLLRPRGALGYAGLHSGLFPAFSDVATRQRFSGWTAQAVVAQRKKLSREATEVDWLLGLQLAMQIVAGPGNSVRHVLAGLLSAVAEEGRPLVEAAWTSACPQRAELVVAAIGGGASEQTWTNFARALHAALQVSLPGGTIVLCTEMRCGPGISLQRLSGSDDDERLWRRLQSDHTDDAAAAALLLEHRQSQHIYLLSDLDAAVVEALGIGSIQDPREISRLTDHAASCLLLQDAHRTVLHVA